MWKFVRKELQKIQQDGQQIHQLKSTLYAISSGFLSRNGFIATA